MAFLGLTRTGLYLVSEGQGRFFPHGDLLDEEGRPQYEKALLHAKEALKAARAKGPLSLGLAPDLALLRLAPFPTLEGFPLEEAVLAEAERNPLFGQEELLLAYAVLGPEAPNRVRVLFAAWPKRAARLFAQLRPRRVEPLALPVLRLALAEAGEAESLAVVDALSDTLALFREGRLEGLRRLSLPATGATPSLAEEIQRSLALFGQADPPEVLVLFGLPEPPPVPPGLRAGRVVRLAEAEALEEAAQGEGPLLLDLRGEKRTALWGRLPREVQGAVLLSAFLFATTLALQSWLGARIQAQLAANARLAQEVARLKALAEASPSPPPPGVGVPVLWKVVEAIPEGLWLDRLEANAQGIQLTGRALNPTAPVILVARLGGRLSYIQKEGQAFRWEVQVAAQQAQAR